MLNAAVRRDPVQVIDLLVHESSHGLLFGLSADKPLTDNTGLERHASPLRSDPRPIDGIFHAAFVTTRVHLAMARLLDSGRLDPRDAGAAVRSRESNGIAARESIAILEQHALLTEPGRRIFDELRGYWEKVRQTHCFEAPTAMGDRTREVLLAAVRAGFHDSPPPAAIADAIVGGNRKLEIRTLEFDSLAWMEFCIAVELHTGQELSPADIEPMTFLFEIEDWLRARL